MKMPCWYYEKKDLRNTPSVKEGIDFDTERRYRKEGARFIMECGTAMGLGHNTMATGIVYFHRFYMFHSFRTFPRYVTACCCLLLAGKVEETPKKVKDIIKTAKGLLSEQKFLSFGDDPKEEVMTLERILLQTIKFDLQVDHPYGFLVKYAKCFKGDSTKLQKMVQMAWNFVNDSLSTTVCLQWEPEIIAVALIHLASKLSKFTVTDWTGKQPNHLRWWDMFVADVTMEILEDICHQVLDLYQQANNNAPTPDSPPQLPPSKASPPMKRAHLASPATKPEPTLVTPVKMGDDKLDSGAPIPKIISTDNLHYPYSAPYPPMYSHPPPYGSTAPPLPGAIPSASSTYPPSLFQQSSSAVPQHYTPSALPLGHPPAHASTYYQGPPGRQPYYPPPT
ncbi:cyclin-K [Phlebotomus papatasi]|uniref:cyclin-K n=1 Tax=Phlebotomus papatasi TaxID=29031 RepID=UPI002483F395|nr:cyclin-K [Phlebotomus papatasi]